MDIRNTSDYSFSMDELLQILEEHKEIRGFDELIKEERELREYYYSKQYNAMSEHIKRLTNKYLIETLAWNAEYQVMPETVHKSFINAENFLRAKGISMLVEKEII